MSKKEVIEVEYVEATLENTLEQMKNRRDYLKKVMKPAEDAAKDLEKATATEKVRLQGTKENKVPNLKPYTESLDVKDRHELGKLIEGAKKYNRPWTVKRCSEEKLKEGFRYTFFTDKIEKPFTESLHRNDLVLNEDKDTEEETIELKPTEVDIPVEILPVDELPDTTTDNVLPEDEHLKAIDILKTKLNFHPGEKEGTFVICLTDEDGKETECVELKDLSEEELTTLNAVFFEHEEFAKEQDEKALDNADVVPDEEAVDLELDVTDGEDKDLEEASSAEKRAFKNGGDDLKDLEFGKALARIRDPHERAMLLHQHKLEQSGKRMSDRVSTEDTLARKLRQAGAATNKKMNAMHDAGYSLSEEVPLDEGVKISLDDLTLFKPWGGAKDVWELIIAQDKLEELNKALEDMYPEGITATDLNDILWFEKDWIFDTIDLKSFVPQGDAVEAEVIETETPVEEN